jgi:hypothetical protein
MGMWTDREDLARAIDVASVTGTSLPAGCYVEDGDVRRLVRACLTDAHGDGRNPSHLV